MQEFQASLSTPGPDLSGLIAAAERFYEPAKAPAMIKAFDSDLASFRAFPTGMATSAQTCSPAAGRGSIRLASRSTAGEPG